MSPFRELFVELPSDLFDVLKGIGEEAARRASGTLDMSSMGPMLETLYAPGRMAAVVDIIGQPVRPGVLRRLGLTSLVVRYAAMDHGLEVIARRRCGHKVSGSLSDTLIESAPNDRWPSVVTAALEAAVAKRCYCVEVPGDV